MSASLMDKGLAHLPCSSRFYFTHFLHPLLTPFPSIHSLTFLPSFHLLHSLSFPHIFFQSFLILFLYIPFLSSLSFHPLPFCTFLTKFTNLAIGRKQILIKTGTQKCQSQRLCTLQINEINKS